MSLDSPILISLVTNDSFRPKESPLSAGATQLQVLELRTVFASQGDPLGYSAAHKGDGRGRPPMELRLTTETQRRACRAALGKGLAPAQLSAFIAGFYACLKQGE